MNAIESLKLATSVFAQARNLSIVPRLDVAVHARKQVASWGSMFSMAYLSCELAKARAISALPVAVYQRTDDGREKLHTHPLTRLLAGRANDAQSGLELLQWASLFRDTFGTAYIWVEYERGVPVALWPVTAGVSVDFDRAKPKGRRLTYTVSAGGKFVPPGTYLGHEIVAIKTPVQTEDALEGRSIAELAAAEIGLSIDLEDYYSSVLHNGNHAAGHVEIDGSPTGNAKMAEALTNAIEAKKGVKGAGKTPIFWNGAKWVQHQMTMRDASVIEQQTWVLQQVCRATRVPPMKVYENSNSTYTNSEQNRIEFATDTVKPEVAAVEAAFAPILAAMGDAECYLHFELNGLMEGDSAARAAYYQIMRYAGVYNGNEIRASEDMNRVDGLDGYLVPANYAIIENGELHAVTTGAEPAVGGASAKMAADRILDDARVRISARVARDGDTPASRDFARTVLSPIALAYADLREDLKIDQEIERAFENAENRR